MIKKQEMLFKSPFRNPAFDRKTGPYVNSILNIMASESANGKHQNIFYQAQRSALTLVSSVPYKEYKKHMDDLAKDFKGMIEKQVLDRHLAMNISKQTSRIIQKTAEWYYNKQNRLPQVIRGV